jgi:hypothetical protein
MSIARWVLPILAWTIGPVALAAQNEALQTFLEPVGELRLEEKGAHVVAGPNMVADPLGGWIYWDQQVNDVRLYDREGRLRSAFGRKGEGPGEFQRIIGAVRLGDGRLAVIDARGHLSVWTATGDSLLDDFNSGVAVPRGLVPVGIDEVVVYGRPQARGTDDFTSPVLHHISVSERTEVATAFEPPVSSATYLVARGVESPRPWARHDTVFVVMVPFDSLWAVAGVAPFGQRSIPIRSTAILANPPAAMAAEGRAQYHAWVEQATLPGTFAAMPDGGWLMQTWGLRSSGPVRGLARMDAEGRLIWEVGRTPQLLAVDPQAGGILLWDPDTLEPGVVTVMKERRPGRR